MLRRVIGAQLKNHKAYLTACSAAEREWRFALQWSQFLDSLGKVDRLLADPRRNRTVAAAPARGLDVIIIRDGKIAALYVFLDPMP